MKNKGSKNNFSNWIRSLLDDVKCCQKCGSNNMCSIHHIFSRISSSMFNAIILCQKCHAEADSFNRITGVKGRSYRIRLFRISQKFWKNLINQSGIDIPKKEQEKNAEFLNIISEDIPS